MAWNALKFHGSMLCRAHTHNEKENSFVFRISWRKKYMRETDKIASFTKQKKFQRPCGAISTTYNNYYHWNVLPNRLPIQGIPRTIPYLTFHFVFGGLFSSFFLGFFSSLLSFIRNEKINQIDWAKKAITGLNKEMKRRTKKKTATFELFAVLKECFHSPAML